VIIASLSVCVCVCVLAGYLKKLLTDLNQIIKLCKMVDLGLEEYVTFLID